MRLQIIDLGNNTMYMGPDFANWPSGLYQSARDKQSSPISYTLYVYKDSNGKGYFFRVNAKTNYLSIDPTVADLKDPYRRVQGMII
jgi:hypothetical protein